MSVNGKPQTFNSATAAAPGMIGGTAARSLLDPVAATPNLPIAYALCQLLGWGTWAVLGAILSARSAGVRFDTALASYGLYSIYGVITSHLLRVAIRRNGWLLLPFGTYLPRVIAMAALGVVAMTASLYLINIRLLHLFQAGAYLAPFLSMVAFNTALVYAFWLVIYLSVHASRRRRHAELIALRTQLALRDAQYRSLSAQVNPHFLFNSLNSLRALILVDPQKAITAVTHLAGVLRYSLAADAPGDGISVNDRVVPLRHELEAVDDYLALERIRFEDRLRVTRQIDPAALQATVPRMMLQHLVENAVKHGIAPRSEGGEIHVSARVLAGRLQITVSNPGHITPSSTGTSLGLLNTRLRLVLLYGPGSSAGCTLEEHSGIVVAALTLPLETQDASSPHHQLQEAVDARPSR